MEVLKEKFWNIFYELSEMVKDNKDIPSQKKCDAMAKLIITLFSVVGFFIGFFTQKFVFAVGACLMGTALALIVNEKCFN